MIGAYRLAKGLRERHAATGPRSPDLLIYGVAHSREFLHPEDGVNRGMHFPGDAGAAAEKVRDKKT